MTVPHQNSMTSILATYRRPETTDFGNAWVGMEPTFQSEKSIRKWAKLSAKPGGEDAYFEDRYMLKMQRRVARKIQKKYYRYLHQGSKCCMFECVELDDDLDQWKVRRQNLQFHWKDRALEPFEVRFSLDPETFEYSIKPVPLAWFYDNHFVEFLQEFIWAVPLKLGLTPSMAHGGGQFSLSAKTFLTGSLLADDIAYKVSHPELSTWIMDWPNCDDRCFRATRPRLAAFERIIQQYWAGDFHPQNLGQLTAEHAYLDRGFFPVHTKTKGLMDQEQGPVGSERDIFQTNFAFGRAVRLLAQNVYPGYWQSAHPNEEGYRPDQIMRYSEGNLNRLQIVGELHVKSGKVLDLDRVPELNIPLDITLLTEEASWENRGQMGRTSASDFVEALLLDVHHAQYLASHPHVSIRPSLLQDQLLGDSEVTLKRHGAEATLERLQREARTYNLEVSQGRIKSNWIEPETLFWMAWKVLPAGERDALAREVISGFLERVEQATSMDPRENVQEDPMEGHRHRIHPVLWQALEPAMKPQDKLYQEFITWKTHQGKYQARRPTWSPLQESSPPWNYLE